MKMAQLRRSDIGIMEFLGSAIQLSIHEWIGFKNIVIATQSTVPNRRTGSLEISCACIIAGPVIQAQKIPVVNPKNWVQMP